MATLYDIRNLEKTNVAGPALEEFSTRARSVVSERETRLKQGESFYVTDHVADLADAGTLEALITLPLPITCVADMTIKWAASGLCLVELFEGSNFGYEFSGTTEPYSTTYNKRRLSENVPYVRIGTATSGVTTGGSNIFTDITGVAGAPRGHFRFMPKATSITVLDPPATSRSYGYLLKMTNKSGDAAYLRYEVLWTEYEEIGETTGDIAPGGV